jgi:hypothetical protein
MKLSSVIARIPAWYEAGKCVYLKSAPGRGKTQVLTSSAALLSKSTGKNIGLVLISGPLLTPADSIGYLVPRKVTGIDADGHPVEHMESVYTDPFWFRTKEGKRLDEYDGGIIVVDEADKMDVDVKKVIGEAALSGRLGPHQLPPGWIVWMAGNRQKDRSGSTKELDHLINRRMEIDITDDIDSWNDFANTHDVTPITKAFANQNVHIVFSDGVPEKQGPWCTPRSLVEADDYLKVLAKHNNGSMPEDAHTMEEIGGMIGEAAAAQLFSFVKLETEMPKYEDIIAKPSAVKVPGKPDAAMLICYNLAHRVTMEHCNAVIEYVDRLPKEFGVIFGKAAIARDPRLITTAGFMKWIKENASLMAQIQHNGR